MSWNPFRRTVTPPEAAPKLPAKPHWTTHFEGAAGYGVHMMEAALDTINKSLPTVSTPGVAMDDSSNGMPRFKTYGMEGLPDALLGWFASQTFIGYQTCAIVAQHWLVDKACTMPARDAIRHGYDVNIEGLPALPPSLELDPLAETPPDEDEREANIAEDIRKYDKKFRVRFNMEQFIRMGRVFGIRVLLFKVDSVDPNYYENPFNPDGVAPGSYKGITQIDPYWCIPVLDAEAASDPANSYFYEPTWWLIRGKKYHRTHLRIFRNSEPPDMLKPMYNYGGVSVPQKIMERVYAAERTANEGPQLAMTKRTLVWNTDVGAFLANPKAGEHMVNWAHLRDNYGVKIVDTDDKMTQIDTGLADLDATIMTQYQLVAAAAGVPATKLLGTTPKGFNSTGEYEESSYHEELETIQTNDLDSFLERHYTLLCRSFIEPGLKLEPGTLTVRVDWAPVDSPTAEEYATINKTNADTDSILVNAGAIDGMDVRNRLKKDPNSNYTGLADVADVEETPEDIINRALGNDPPPETPPANPDPTGLGGEPQRGAVPGKAPNPQFGNRRKI